MFVDSHCHLDFPELAGSLDQALDRMRDNRVTHALCVCVKLEDFPRVREIAERYPHVYGSVGVHPDYEDVREADEETLVALSSHPKIVAIGETGLDYFRMQGEHGWQQDRFRTHIRAARRARKPLIVHTRAAADDTLRIMREEQASEAGGVMHCFTESWPVARAALDLGFYISFSGIVTFKNAEALRDVARRVPLDRVLIETDAPFLAPVPHRGKTNEPGFVRHVAEELARQRGMMPAEIGAATSDNFFRLFNVL